MNIFLYLIFGWIAGEFFHFTMWEWCKVKFKLDNKKVKTILIFVGIALLISIVGSGFYRVNSNENIILTSITGYKTIKENIGIKYSPLSSRESVNIQKQLMKFPAEYSDNGYEIITLDEKPVLINSFLEFKIIDVSTWGIKNKDCYQKLLISFASNVKNTIKKSEYKEIKENIDKFEEEVKKDMINLQDAYGIKIIDINLQISDTVSVKQSKSHAEEQKISSESLKESYLSESEALKTKYNSIEDKEFIKYMEFINAIKEGYVEVIVIPQESVIPYNLNGETK